MEAAESKYLFELGELFEIFDNDDDDDEEIPFFVDAELKIGAGDEVRELTAPVRGDETADEEPFSVIILLVGEVDTAFGGAGVDEVGGGVVTETSFLTSVVPSLDGSADCSLASVVDDDVTSSVEEFLRLSSDLSSVGVGFNKDKIPPCLDLSPEGLASSPPPGKSETLDCLSLFGYEEFADCGEDILSEPAVTVVVVVVLLGLLLVGVPITIGGATLVVFALLLPFIPLLLELLEAQLLCLLLLVSGGVAMEKEEMGGMV